MNESNAKVRIGFVGCGMMGQTVHLPNFVSLPDCEVVALSELRERVGRQVAAKFGIPAFYTSFEEMLAQQHLDAVVMILQYSQNPELAPIVLQSGKPVYLEKPIALSAADGQTIAQAAAANGTDAMVAYHKRYDPGVEKAKALIDEFRASGSLGGIVGARVWNHHGDWIAGYSREDVDREFSFMLNAFKFGAPPHGGIAPGVDRIVMLLAEEENIREVIAFPMNQRAQDLMMNAPAEVTRKQLRELHLKVDLPKDED